MLLIVYLTKLVRTTEPQSVLPVGSGRILAAEKPPQKGKSMHANQVVADMVDEVLGRQALARAHRTGESFEDALDAVLGTEAGQQLQELRDGPHRHERADKWQASIAQQRIEEWGGVLGRCSPREALVPS